LFRCRSGSVQLNHAAQVIATQAIVDEPVKDHEALISSNLRVFHVDRSGNQPFHKSPREGPMAKGDVHVVWRDDDSKWAVEKEGISRASSLHDTKESAAMAGRENAINERSELLIHGKDGKIQERNTYKQDPYPPRG
jgi:hypothetical protein